MKTKTNQMKKIVTLLVIITICHVSFSQEKIGLFKNDLAKNSSAIKDVVPIVNQKNDEISLFFIDTKNVYGYLLDTNFNVIDKLSAEDKNKKYKLVIGSSISDSNDYRIFLSDNKNKSFATVNLSYNAKEATIKEFTLKSSKEEFIQTINHNNQFYLLSVLKGTSLLGLYTFDDDGNPKLHGLDFNRDKFFDIDGQEETLYDLFNSEFSKPEDITKIDKDNPNSIEVTSAFTKLYVRGNKVTITFDENKDFTQVISFDLLTFEKEVKKFPKPLESIKANKKKSNSFIYGKNIFMLSASDQIAIFNINDFDSGAFIKEYIAEEEDSISFKNSPIIQDGGMYDRYREMEKTKKFLRKITAAEVGISIYKNDNIYQITLGGRLEIKASGGGMMMPGMPGITMASFGAVSTYFNPSFFAYNAYAHSKSTFIECLFDENFEHINGEPKENVFDKIKEFKEPASTVQSAHTLFKYKDYFVVGNLVRISNEYWLRKFED